MLAAFPNVTTETLRLLSSILGGMSVAIVLGTRLYTNRREQQMFDLGVQAGPEVRDVANRANLVARSLGHEQVTPDHILAAIMAQPLSPVAVRLQEQHGIAASNARRLTTPSPGASVDRLAPDPLMYDRRCVKVFEATMLETARDGERDMGVEHLVLGIVVAGTSNAARRLSEGGVSPATWRDASHALKSRHG